MRAVAGVWSLLDYQRGVVTMTTGKKTLISLVQDEIDKGATTIEEINKAYSRRPSRGRS